MKKHPFIRLKICSQKIKLLESFWLPFGPIKHVYVFVCFSKFLFNPFLQISHVFKIWSYINPCFMGPNLSPNPYGSRLRSRSTTSRQEASEMRSGGGTPWRRKARSWGSTMGFSEGMGIVIMIYDICEIIYIWYIYMIYIYIWYIYMIYIWYIYIYDIYMLYMIYIYICYIWLYIV